MSNTSGLRLNYKNIKTGSYINFPDDDLETYIYVCRMLNYNDKRVLNNQMQKLVNALTNVKIKKEGDK